MNKIFLNKANSNVKVFLPSIEYFIEKIKNKEHFIFVKVNHGWWEAAVDVTEKNINLKSYIDLIIKSRLNKLKHPWYTKVKYNILYKQNLIWVNILKNYDKYPENLFVGVSPTNGIGYDLGAKQLKSLKLIESWSNDNKPFYHGGLFRHYAIMGELDNLISVINKKKINVHFIGPSYCKQYKSLFSSFNFIEIPKYNGANKINQILKNLKDNANEGDIVLASFGDSESLLIDLCFDKKLTYIGIGRSFDYLFKEKISGQLWLKVSEDKLKEGVKKWRTI